MWVHGEETGGGKADIDARKRIIVPKSSHINWDIDLEMIGKMSSLSALLTEVIVRVNGPAKTTSHNNNPICAVPEC